ncbi:hypothetical protein STBA_02200 [Streptomyces sp. MP131-18]|nr:hypothetical protein STBA_02200 [Streptomyces sp. MP131-18]
MCEESPRQFHADQHPQRHCRRLDEEDDGDRPDQANRMAFTARCLIRSRVPADKVSLRIRVHTVS